MKIKALTSLPFAYSKCLVYHPDNNLWIKTIYFSSSRTNRMRFNSAIFLSLLSLTTLTLASRDSPVLILRRDACTDINYVDCDDSCMPAGYICCGDGDGGFCPGGSACFPQGCCPLGETCDGGGGTMTYDIFISGSAVPTGDAAAPSNTDVVPSDTFTVAPLDVSTTSEAVTPTTLAAGNTVKTSATPSANVATHTAASGGQSTPITQATNGAPRRHRGGSELYAVVVLAVGQLFM
jgi:hypothetical protein